MLSGLAARCGNLVSRERKKASHALVYFQKSPVSKNPVNFIQKSKRYKDTKGYDLL
jgi:hypothetical protein